MYSQFQPIFQHFLKQFPPFQTKNRAVFSFPLFKDFSKVRCEEFRCEQTPHFSGGFGRLLFALHPVQLFHRPYYYD